MMRPLLDWGPMRLERPSPVRWWLKIRLEYPGALVEQYLLMWGLALTLDSKSL